MNRDLILINSALDGRAEWLGNQLAKEDYSQLFVEHISVNKIVRSLGGTALKSIDNVALYDAVSDALTVRDGVGLVLISNYPQLSSSLDDEYKQIDDIYELAALDDRNLAGLIIPDSSKSESIMHILSDNRVPLTVPAAESLLLHNHQKVDPIIIELYCRELPIQFVDMSKSEQEIIYDATQSVERLLR